LSKFIPILSTKRLRPDVLRQALLDNISIMDYDFVSVSFIGAPVDLKETLVFTSRNAVTAFSQTNQPAGSNTPYKIYCLGGETLSSLGSIPGIKIAATADDAKTLAKRIIDDKVKELSFICGSRRRDDLPELLQHEGINVHEEKVYNTVHTGHPVKHAYKGVLFFSPSAVESFFQTNVLAAGIPCFCIGNTTAAMVKEHTDTTIVIAKEVSQESMVKAVKEYFKKNRLKHK
jgi:uroporphyrinogen-III synthase